MGHKASKKIRRMIKILFPDKKTLAFFLFSLFILISIFSVGFYNDMMKGLEYVNKPATAQKVRKDLPMYLIAGDNDPVSKNGKQVKDVFEMYKNTGISDISMKLYEDARHEILNETNKDEVYKDVLNWLESHL